MPWARAPYWELERFGEGLAVRDERSQSLTYRELAALADAAAAVLRPAQVFGLSCANTRAGLALYLGALRRGAVPLMLDGALAAPARAALLAAYGVGACFDAATAAWTGDPATAATPPVHDMLGLLLSTSGSTASPKLVRLSRDNLAANAGSIAAYLGLGPQEVAITTLPMHYSFGLSIVNSHLGCGARVVLTEDTAAQAAFWQRMRDESVTSLSGVPTLWRLLRRLRFERMALPALRTLTQAGGRLEPDEIAALAADASAAGRRLFVMYGQTEATARIAYVPPAQLQHKAGSIGIAIPGGELGVLAANGQLAPEGPADGELVYRGPNVMLGYAETPADLLRGAEVDWLRTGDLARRDADGFHWITGRLKRFVKLFGHRINLDEVEAGLRARGLQAAVVGRDDRLQLAVVGQGADACQALARELAAELRCTHQAVQVWPVDALPLGSNGKPLYARLQALLDEREAAHA
ncbi:AMP-binding protein [Roseateles cellulosilyticus]|uniref:AMP-binding protein n=1 Tax=Pelomonas cellulosilytica TaxID=2906762 RepID=A0ABS8XWE7_9BURK|nr:AMP-binding protein [Pelomonas sp. P8]MCE4556117.1 AMP-binding protein [Pelomonas sp. P8]